MKIAKYTEIDPTDFDGGAAKSVKGRVAIGKNDGAPNFCMRVFTIGSGGHTPRHSHEWEHEIFVHSGNGKILCDGQWQDVAPGSVVFVPGGQEHQLKNEGSEEFVFVCLIPSGVAEL